MNYDYPDKNNDLNYYPNDVVDRLTPGMKLKALIYSNRYTFYNLNNGETVTFLGFLKCNIAGHTEVCKVSKCKGKLKLLRDSGRITEACIGWTNPSNGRYHMPFIIINEIKISDDLFELD